MTIWTMLRAFWLLLVPLILFQPDSLLGQSAQPTGPKGDEEIEITADSLSVREAGTEVEAKGNVVIRREETVLRAEEVRVNRETQEAEMKGRVSVDDPEWKLEAESAQFNLREETAEIEDGDVFIEEGHISVSGKRFQKSKGQVYSVEEGLFTTCFCEEGPQPWKIGAEQIELTEEGTGIVRGGTFYLLDVPVLYLPYGFFPLRTERQTGFLFPQLGSSSEEGFQYQQPFFWAISKSSDATLALDVETSARVGVLGEYRTIFSRDAHLRFLSSYFNEGLRDDANEDIQDATIADPSIPQDRWMAAGSYRQKFYSEWEAYSDAIVFSDDLFTRELVDRFDLVAEQGVDQWQRQADIRTSRYGRSTLGFFRSWGDTLLRGDWQFYQDFIQSDAETFQQTPQISFWGSKFFAEPFEFRWNAEFMNYLRRKGADGLRFDLRPEIVAPFQFMPYLFGSFRVAFRETAYHLYDTVGVFDRNTSRELVEVRNHFGTSVGRTFDWNGASLKKIRHVIEPGVSYLFIPFTNQDDIPIMDWVDRINRRNVVTFSLVNRLWGKFGVPRVRTDDQEVEILQASTPDDIREIGRLGFALSYDVDKERNGGDTLSDLDISLELNPQNYFTLRTNLGLNPGPWQVSQAAVVLSLADPRPITRQVLDEEFMKPNSLDLTYRYVRKTPLTQMADDANLTTLSPEREIPNKLINEIGGELLYHLTDFLLLRVLTSYNFTDNRLIGNRTSLKFLSQCECWTVTFAVNYETNPDKTSFGFNLNLLGLGSSGDGLF